MWIQTDPNTLRHDATGATATRREGGGIPSVVVTFGSDRPSIVLNGDDATRYWDYRLAGLMLRADAREQEPAP